MSVDVRLDNKIRIKDIAVTMPKTLHNTSVFEQISTVKCPNLALAQIEELDFSKFISQQHSLIKAWLFCSAFAICLLSMLLFTTH